MRATKYAEVVQMVQSAQCTLHESHFCGAGQMLGDRREDSRPARPSVPCPAAGNSASPSSGPMSDHAIFAQLLDIALHGRLVPHLAVHGRRQHHRAGKGQAAAC